MANKMPVTWIVVTGRKVLSNRLEVEDILRNDLERAKKEYEAARRNFWQVCSDVPSGIPHPDSERRILKTALVQTHAMNGLATALKRFNDYLINGTVPEDLKPADP
jgi:hypothetical protein